MLNLFVGYPLSSKLKEQFNPRLLRLFQDYLSEIEIEESPYIGKKMDALPTLEELDNAEAHILSLLQRIAPNHTFSTCQLIAL
ncbi:MAG: hypothetical protein S4CHLAM45_00670 [Chlamydiales bacterium]|nr:hypothetical protein [Chlamydiales bacterium]MCH9619389.1 hypothetical protein [Chlamydiales bacterium]MCH9622193.1 hypothetical protein [Chlamydiales bacterium]